MNRVNDLNFIEITVSDPQTHGTGTKKYTDYEVKTKTNYKHFRQAESIVRRRFSDFEWLRAELESRTKMIVPSLPDKAFVRQLPFRNLITKDNGIFDETFIEDRRRGLEEFINKASAHPLALNEKCLHMFLQDELLDKNYKPEKIPNV